MDEKKILDAVSREIRSHRHALKLSQEELAFKANIDRSYLSEIESGKKNVSLLIFIALAHALEIKPSVLLAAME